MSGKQLEPFRIDYRTQARRLLTFAIGGTKQLPPKAPDTLVPVADPDFRPDAAAEQRGTMIFHGRCLQCHGINAIAGGAAPDLRTSAIPQSAEAFKAVVHGGALLENGMPRFDWASDAQLDDLRQYIRAQAAAWRAGKKGG
jgi:quinohemoprotein ethanol dehydrogenase